MTRRYRTALLALVYGGVAFAGPSSAQSTPAAPVPYTSLPDARVATPETYRPSSFVGGSGVASVLRAARSGDLNAEAYASDSVSRKVALWATVDVSGEVLPFSTLDRARTELKGWPREERRAALAERALADAGRAPSQVIAWFGTDRPTTAEGAMALADALIASGREAEAQALVKRFWREELFDSEPQGRMLARYGRFLTREDHVARLDSLLLGPQGPATRAVMDLVGPDHRALAEARMAYRQGSSRAGDLLAAVPTHLANDPGLAFERASSLRRRGLEPSGFDLLARFPAAPAHEDGQKRLWTERKLYLIEALRARNWRAAYDAMAGHGFPRGEWRAEAEFYAGWVALTKLNDPNRAAHHFLTLEQSVSTPVSLARAAYWRGRAAEAQGDRIEAQQRYLDGAKWPTTFYGQHAAERAGQRTLTLGPDPEITAEDRARLERRDLVSAARALADAGEANLLEIFVLAADDQVETAGEAAALVDLARAIGGPDLGMKVVRAAFGRGFVMPERAYPIRDWPQVSTSAEPAFVLAVTRQESSFDPSVRSSADARGMMQLLPTTARAVARRLGVGWEPSRLYEADYNMRLGAFHLGELIDNFGGSYAMAASGYNAGPGRPLRWIEECADPRSAADPLDYVECIPFSETRNYVMRVLENTAVYRARLNGGTAPLTPRADLARGSKPLTGGPRPYTSLN
jgi:soluble lytic murein transglycosylase